MEYAPTLIEQFYHWERETPNDTFLRQPFGNLWEEYTWSEVGQKARRLASFINSLQLPKQSHIGLISKNCREWIITDLAIMMTGNVSVPLYPTLSAKQLNEVLRLGDVKVLFVGKIDHWKQMKSGVPSDLITISFPTYEGFSEVEADHSWLEIMQDYQPIKGNPQPGLDDLWTIVFTSGTTGKPKGVMHSYRLLKNVSDSTLEMNVLKSQPGNNRFFSYLPLNHIAERAAVEAQCMFWGGSISFVESLETFLQNLQSARPTLFFGVPRIFTKLQLGVLAKLPQLKLDRLLKIPVVRGVIKRRVQSGLGLDKARTILVGAAPMSQSLKKWYKDLGMPISEGYGMTENIGVSTFLYGTDDRPGSIGKFYPDNEVRVDDTTGEICIKCPWNMLGYYKDPEKTNEVLKDGWLHTGDKGYIDEEGYVYLTGRVKDSFKTAKGKFVVPAPIEWKFAHTPDIEQVCVAGLGLPQPMGLIVISEIGKKKDPEELTANLNQILRDVNEELAPHEKISHLVIVKDTWSVENDLLTPTLKVKRRRINDVYLPLMTQWAQKPNGIIWET